MVNMGVQLCPKCQNTSFTWSIDDDISESTIWRCYKCNYEAYENESDERKSSHCNQKTESKLKDNEKEYWWCFTCNASNNNH